LILRAADFEAQWFCDIGAEPADCRGDGIGEPT
jgi:hypothetical protein